MRCRKNFLAPCNLADVRKICTSSNMRSYTADMRHMSTKFMSLATPQSALSFIVLLNGLSIFGSTALVPWTGDQPVARPLLTHGTTQTQNKTTQISMP
jgi:hypothetical protein